MWLPPTPRNNRAPRSGPAPGKPMWLPPTPRDNRYGGTDPGKLIWLPPTRRNNRHDLCRLLATREVPEDVKPPLHYLRGLIFCAMLDAYHDEHPGIRSAYRNDGHLLNSRRMQAPNACVYDYSP
ncbi:unnamed protein product [Schistocephalus solidus]|uniref:Transposase n=1 Tax=Schistocephalus solidus TaxID=70667 RepID=A0A183THQ5_SCHSO|nr:unnamed protein product [Schistocephalus solidus]